MDLTQGMSASANCPAWLRGLVPVEEIGQWMQAAKQPEGLNKAGLYVLGEVLGAYGFEMGAAWSWGWMQRSIQTGNLAQVLSWGSSVAMDLQAAIGAWDGAVYWVERWPDGAGEQWLAWIGQRKQLLAQGRQQVCQECATWCEQAQSPLPRWLLGALGLAPEVVEVGGAAVQQQANPGYSYQG